MIKEIQGDLLMADVDVICHQVNCQGAMRSGIAKSIRDKYPKVYYEYVTKCDNMSADLLLGLIQIVDTEEGPLVVNMFGQLHYGYDNRRYTSYDAFWNCLNLIATHIPANASIGFPKNIGCCRGGANWNIIRAMIEEVLGDREVYIYELGI